MHTITIEDLENDGIIDHNGWLLETLNFEHVTGQESGIWFDYNGSVPYVSCNNFCGCSIFYKDDGTEARITELTAERMSADEAIDDEDEWARIRFENPEDKVALRKNPMGTLYTLKLKVDGFGETYYFFAPDDWA